MCRKPATNGLPNFWQNYGKQVADYVRRRVRDEDASKDLTQDIFVKIYTFCQKHDFSCEKAGVTNLRSWIFQIAQNTITDHARRERRFLKADVLPEVADVLTEKDAYGRAQYLIEPLMALMSPTYAQPLQWADLDRISQQEVANRLNISLSGAKSRIQRGREKLRSLLEECTLIETNEKGELIWMEAKPSCVALLTAENKVEKKCKKDASFQMCCSS